jgi:hypothetical protein
MLMFQNTTHFKRERKSPSTFCFSLLSGGFEYYKNEKQKTPHLRNNSKIKYQSRRKRQNRYPIHAQIHDPSLSWLGADISIKSGGITLF